MRNVYRHSDKAIKLIYRFIERTFQQTALTAKWDELNVFRISGELFQQVDTFARAQFQWIAENAYQDAKREILQALPEKEKDLKGLDTLFMMAVLSGYDSKTSYRYDKEWERKRDRLAESVMAVIQNNELARITNSNEVRVALERSMHLMQRQVREMADTMTDEARNEAFEQAGIWEAKWNAEHDSKTCAECKERDGQIYPLDALPPKHPHCRCWITAVIAGTDSQSE